MPKFLTLFNRKDFPASQAGYVCKTASQTLQEFKDEADINLLVARYKNTGSYYNPLNPPTGERRMPEFLDCTTVPDLMEAEKMVAESQRLFEALPASVRDWCDNNPIVLLAAWHNPQLRPTVEALMSGKSAVNASRSYADNEPAAAPGALRVPDNPAPGVGKAGELSGNNSVGSSQSAQGNSLM